MATQIESQKKTCPTCHHFKFCLVCWGTDCKRQGGRKIPRMKPMPVELRWTVNKQESKKPSKKTRLQSGAMFERISTKITNW